MVSLWRSVRKAKKQKLTRPLHNYISLQKIQEVFHKCFVNQLINRVFWQISYQTVIIWQSRAAFKSNHLTDPFIQKSVKLCRFILTLYDVYHDSNCRKQMYKKSMFYFINLLNLKKTIILLFRILHFPKILVPFPKQKKAILYNKLLIQLKILRMWLSGESH